MRSDRVQGDFVQIVDNRSHQSDKWMLGWVFSRGVFLNGEGVNGLGDNDV